MKIEYIIIISIVSIISSIGACIGARKLCEKNKSDEKYRKILEENTTNFINREPVGAYSLI